MARKNWMTALVCCALLALGACSSSSDKKTVDTGGGNNKTIEQTPGEGTLAAAVRDLEDAQTAVKVAQAAFDTAIGLKPRAMSQADDVSAAAALTPLQTSARDTLERALAALTRAVTSAGAALDAATEADDKDKAQEAVDKAEAYKIKAEKDLKLASLTVKVWEAKVAVAKGDATPEEKTALADAQKKLDGAVSVLIDEDDQALKTKLKQVSTEVTVLRKSLAWAKGAGLTPGDASAAVMGTVDVDRRARINPGGSGGG